MYSSKFLKAFEYLMKYETREVTKHEPCGATKYGISQSSCPHINIKTLTRDKAKQIYFCDFWIKGKYEDIDDEDLAIRLFDFAVQIGIPRVSELIHRVLQASDIDVGEDGIIVTINNVDSTDLLAALKSEIERGLRREDCSLSRLKELQRWRS